MLQKFSEQLIYGNPSWRMLYVLKICIAQSEAKEAHEAEIYQTDLVQQIWKWLGLGGSVKLLVCFPGHLLVAASDYFEWTFGLY